MRRAANKSSDSLPNERRRMSATRDDDGSATLLQYHFHFSSAVPSTNKFSRKNVKAHTERRRRRRERITAQMSSRAGLRRREDETIGGELRHKKIITMMANARHAWPGRAGERSERS